MQTSETFFYRISKEQAVKAINDMKRDFENNIDVILIKSVEDLAKHDHIVAKLYFLPVDKWLRKGCVCFALERQKKVIGYAWVHHGYYHNRRIPAKFQLSENEVWIGPAYIEKSFRGGRLSYDLLHSRFSYLIGHGCTFGYTSTNSKNIPVIRYLKRSNFELIGSIRNMRFGKKILVEFSKKCNFSERIVF